MKLVYMGSPGEAIAPLRYLLEQLACASPGKERPSHSLVGVVSAPAKRSGRGRVLSDPPVASYAKERGLVVLQPNKASDQSFLDELRKLEPDIIITCAYGQILTDAFLSIAKRATINIHPSCLPKYRGATPVQTALLSGESNTAVTILFTVRALDAGAIIVQESFDIGRDEVAGQLLKRLFELSGPLLGKAIQLLEDDQFSGTEQDASQVTHCKKISKEDGLIDWGLSGETILCRYRGYTPWPGVFSFFGERRVTFERISFGRSIEKHQKIEAPCGNCYFDKSRKALLVRAKDAWLQVDLIKPAGSRALNGADFWNGLSPAQKKNGIYFSNLMMGA